MIKTKTSTWYIVSVKMDKMLDNGMLKNVTEKYIVESFSPSEAQESIIEELQAFATGELCVKSCKEETFKEYHCVDGESYDYWFKAKVAMMAFDEAADKEKRTNITYLLNAEDFKMAAQMLTYLFEGRIQDYDILSLVKTNIVDIVEK